MAGLLHPFAQGLGGAALWHSSKTPEAGGEGGGVSIWSTAQLVRSHSQSLGYLGSGEPLGGSPSQVAAAQPAPGPQEAAPCAAAA